MVRILLHDINWSVNIQLAIYDSRYHERHPLCLYHYHDDWLLWLIYLMNFSFVHIHDIHWLMVLFIWKFLLVAVAVFLLIESELIVKKSRTNINRESPYPAIFFKFFAHHQLKVKISATATVIGHLLFLWVQSCFSPLSSPCTPSRMRASLPQASKPACHLQENEATQILGSPGIPEKFICYRGSQPAEHLSHQTTPLLLSILKHTCTPTDTWHSGLGKKKFKDLHWAAK